MHLLFGLFEVFKPSSIPVFSVGVKTGDDDGDGDVFNSKNQDEFRKFVLEGTDGLGVHFMMADGVSVSLSFHKEYNFFIAFSNSQCSLFYRDFLLKAKRTYKKFYQSSYTYVNFLWLC